MHHLIKCVASTIFLLSLLSQGRVAEPETIPFYIGTYTSGASKGIYRSELDPKTGQMATPTLVAELKNPSFLTIHPTLGVLYAVSEVPANDADAQVFSFEIEADGGLRLQSQMPAHGDGPCYISTDATGKFAFVANYGSGSITSYPLGAQGGLQPAVSRHQHVGKSISPRQTGPHAHCIMVDPSNRYVCAVDLGMDKVVVYEFNQQTGKLSPSSEMSTRAGSGPRHMAFHPDGKHAFVIHELTLELTSNRWQDGRLEQLQALSTLPENFSSKNNSTAEVLVHPNGKFVYGSNRGHNSIAIFSFNAADGTLTKVGHTQTGGQTPRNFRIDPTGQILLAENQTSDNIQSFRIDSQTGRLQPLGQSLSLGSPCCIKFLTH